MANQQDQQVTQTSSQENFDLLNDEQLQAISGAGAGMSCLKPTTEGAITNAQMSIKNAQSAAATANKKIQKAQDIAKAKLDKAQANHNSANSLTNWMQQPQVVNNSNHLGGAKAPAGLAH